jgi:hypothetical protein
METFTFWRCVGGAWADGWRYARERPVLVMVVFLVAWLAPYIDEFLRPDRLPPFRILVWVPLAAFVAVRIVVFSALGVNALRFVLLASQLADSEPLFGPCYWRWLGVTWVIVLGVVAVAAVAIGFALGVVFLLALSHVRAPLSVPLLVGGAAIASACLGLVLFTRLSLLRTHVAIGGDMRVSDAWRDSRGRFWSLWAIQTIATLPLLLIAFYVVHSPVAVERPEALATLLGAFADVTGICVGAACAGWLYRRYAQSLSAPGVAGKL